MTHTLSFLASSILKEVVATSGLLPWWDDHVAQWPRVLINHHVGDKVPPVVGSGSIKSKLFQQQIQFLKRRYRFLSWEEYKQITPLSAEATGTILLTFDDGFRESWLAAEELASQGIGSLFLINTRSVDNAYVPFIGQFYFLSKKENGKFLIPLWKSLSRGQRRPFAETRRLCFEEFGLEKVVGPLEEGLAGFGISSAELAHQYDIFISLEQIRRKSSLVEIGNHSHSHYVLSHLKKAEILEDYQLSTTLLQKMLGAVPECFAYPFGVPGIHFNEECLRLLRTTGGYPYIFAASSDHGAHPGAPYEIDRISISGTRESQILGAASQVSPRQCWRWIASRGNIRRNLEQESHR